MLSRTVLFETHVAAGAKMVPFGGWEMPLLYSGILKEHHAVRQAAGMFDVSHMGRLIFRGPDAERFLQKILTRDLRKVAVGRSAYCLIADESGGLIDDAIVTRLADGSFFLVVNASNRPTVLDWLSSHRGGMAVEIDDRTSELAMIAVQGPRAADVAARIVGHELGKQKYYSAAELTYRGAPATLFRSGYTGEDGFEMVLPAGLAAAFWKEAADPAAGAASALPAGLGARDTLRLEAGMPLYGHEYNTSTDGLSAGMDWVIDLDKDFIGAAALRKIKEAGPARKLVGLELAGRKQARQDFPVYAGDRAVGAVTSGALSPTLEKVIAMAYVETALSAPGTALSVGVRDEKVPATVVPLPFYKRKK